MKIKFSKAKICLIFISIKSNLKNIYIYIRRNKYLLKIHFQKLDYKIFPTIYIYIYIYYKMHLNYQQ